VNILFLLVFGIEAPNPSPGTRPRVILPKIAFELSTMLSFGD